MHHHLPIATLSKVCKFYSNTVFCTKQYKFGTSVSCVGLASHWPCITYKSGIATYGLTAVMLVLGLGLKAKNCGLGIGPEAKSLALALEGGLGINRQGH